MAHDTRWLQQLPIEAEITAMRLQGLAYLAEAWGNYRDAVGDPGPEGEEQVLHTLGWALRELAEGLTPPEEPAAAEPPTNGRASLTVVPERPTVIPGGDGR